MTKRVYVAAGIVLKGDEVLICRRPEHLHQGGKWEFPGGKVESGETANQALIRELKEEVNIDAQPTDIFETISFDYPDKQVLLEFILVPSFTGSAEGLEGQEVKWVKKSALVDYEFPAANQVIVKKLISTPW